MLKLHIYHPTGGFFDFRTFGVNTIAMALCKVYSKVTDQQIEIISSGDDKRFINNDLVKKNPETKDIDVYCSPFEEFDIPIENSLIIKLWDSLNFSLGKIESEQFKSRYLYKACEILYNKNNSKIRYYECKWANDSEICSILEHSYSSLYTGFGISSYKSVLDQEIYVSDDILYPIFMAGVSRLTMLSYINKSVIDILATLDTADEKSGYLIIPYEIEALNSDTIKEIHRSHIRLIVSTKCYRIHRPFDKYYKDCAYWEINCVNGWRYSEEYLQELNSMLGVELIPAGSDHATILVNSLVTAESIESIAKKAANNLVTDIHFTMKIAD